MVLCNTFIVQMRQ